MTVTTASALAYYSAHGAALFPLPAGSKIPGSAAFWSVDGGATAASFKHDHSRDPAQWDAWQTANPGCNFGVVAFASGWMIADIDTKIGREAAWAIWCELCAAWGIAPATPHVQSARGGWHVYFQLPAGVDASALRQPDAYKDVVNIRCVGYTVAAGSYYDGTAKGEESGPYQFLTDAAPYPAPAALIALCTRAPRAAPTTPIGSRDKGDTAGLLRWLNERGAFADYESWFQIGMALRIEFGDEGFDLWSLTHDETVDADTAASKWDSFATEPDANSVTLSSFLDRAHKLGWRGTVRKSAQGMFGAVAQLAAASGAKLSSGGAIPLPGGASPDSLVGREAAYTERCAPILADFLSATSPVLPIGDDHPKLPQAMESHPLYDAMQQCIERTMAMAEPTTTEKWRSVRIKSTMAVLWILHADVCESVRRRVEALGRQWPRGIKTEAKGIEDDVERTFVKQEDYIYDARSGLPESDNPDNLHTFLEIIGAEVRFNAWFNRTELRGFDWPEWTPLTDTIIAKLKRRALRTKTRFRMATEFLKEQLRAEADDNRQDPLVDRIRAFAWDGQPRLAIWLSVSCGVPCDIYHQAVGKNVIGGMVKRACMPGAKHDEVMILMGPQGCGKSNLTRAMALESEYHTDSVTFEGTPQNIIPQLFGKLVVELAELDGMARKEVQSIKRFISAQSDNVTLKYEAFATDRARRCVFVGTSNEHNPLVDVTGNRRFLPVRVIGRVNVAWVRANIEQLFAEAVTLLNAGNDFSIPETVWSVAAQHQEAARSVSDMESRLNEWFAETQFTKAAYITVPDLAELCDLANFKNAHGLRNQVLRRLGFREEKPYLDGKRSTVFVRGPEMLPKHIAGLTRYVIGKTTDGRPRVTIRQPVATKT